MDIAEFNLKTYCRICLTIGNNLLDIFMELPTCANVATAIMECAPVNITEGDGLPAVICTQCFNNLLFVRHFRNICIDSDKKLRELIEKISMEGHSSSDCNSTELPLHSSTNVVKCDLNPNDIHLVKQEPYEEGKQYCELTNVVDRLMKHEFNEDSSHDRYLEPEVFLTEYEVKKIDSSAESVISEEEEEYYNPKPYECSDCDKKFLQHNHLVSHKKSHTGNRSLSCSVCEKTFKRMDTLRNHESVHDKNRPFVCEICDRAFKNMSHLNSHKTIHTNVKPFRCEICGKCFRRSDALKKHTMVHSNLKPYRCDECGQGFKLLTHLNTHRLIHSDEKPHECTICNKAFKRADILKKHYKVHSDPTPVVYK